MRNFLIVLIIFCACAVGVSAISWPIYTSLSLAQWFPFDKFTKWLTIITIAMATTIAFRSKRLKFSKIDFLPTQPQVVHSLGFGFISGFLLLALLSVALYLLDVRIIDTSKSLPEILEKFFLSILPVALLVALIEELYFRGIQCNELIHKRRILAAVSLPAIFYSSVHFLNPGEPASFAQREWFHGLTLLLDAPADACRSFDCAGTAVALFFAGVFLGIVRILSGHLIVCIGIHAGWIAAIKTTKTLTDFNPDAKFAWLAQGQGQFLGVLAAILLVMACLPAGLKLLQKHLKGTV